MKKIQKAGRKAENGNITVDLGEAIDKKLRSAIGDARREAVPAKMAGYRPGMFSGGGYRPGPRMGGLRPSFGRPGFNRPGPRMGGLRPSFGRPGFNRPALGGNGGSFKPWYADRDSRFGSSLSMGALGIRPQINTWEMLSGAGIGLIGNRALVRVTPQIPFLKNPSALLHNAIAFVVGVVPALVKQNSVTLGVAVPGAVYLAGSVVDWAFDAIGIARPALSGGVRAPQAGVDAALAARQRLVEMQNRVNPRGAAAAPAPSRVYAQAR
jgi:hypothetical protein